MHSPQRLILTGWPCPSPCRYWYETDGHGGVVALTDSSGQVVDRYTYDLWGDLDTLRSAGLVPQPLRYRGYVYDRELMGHG